jgi:hypothetical protein
LSTLDIISSIIGGRSASRTVVGGKSWLQYPIGEFQHDFARDAIDRMDRAMA